MGKKLVTHARAKNETIQRRKWEQLRRNAGKGIVEIYVPPYERRDEYRGPENAPVYCDTIEKFYKHFGPPEKLSNWRKEMDQIFPSAVLNTLEPETEIELGPHIYGTFNGQHIIRVPYNPDTDEFLPFMEQINGSK